MLVKIKYYTETERKQMNNHSHAANNCFQNKHHPLFLPFPFLETFSAASFGNSGERFNYYLVNRSKTTLSKLICGREVVSHSSNARKTEHWQPNILFFLFFLIIFGCTTTIILCLISI